MNKGFTLIELLVVVAIVGFLASVVIAVIGSAQIEQIDYACTIWQAEKHEVVCVEFFDQDDENYYVWHKDSDEVIGVNKLKYGPVRLEWL